MIKEFQGTQNRYEERMEEHTRRVAQVIGSEAPDALRSPRSHMLHEHQVLLLAVERTRVREKPDALGATVTHCKLDPHMNEKFNESELRKTGIPGGAIESPVVN